MLRGTKQTFALIGKCPTCNKAFRKCATIHHSKAFIKCATIHHSILELISKIMQLIEHDMFPKTFWEATLFVANLANATDRICRAPAFVVVRAGVIVEASLLVKLFSKIATIRMMIELLISMPSISCFLLLMASDLMCTYIRGFVTYTRYTKYIDNNNTSSIQIALGTARQLKFELNY
ncbi:unnamed protein product [Mytilus coruscus]|uniref:Uncharacterized protein n=1 Tax=Mytilus coruscus TaxID=42192 RepID=A0A6J8ATE4_MYTCO|nr:unnamed protein product [Mytilus coruscus]